MTLEMLEFVEDGKVVCVCSAESGDKLERYVKRCRELFNLPKAKAYLRRFEPIGYISVGRGFTVVAVDKLDV